MPAEPVQFTDDLGTEWSVSRNLSAGPDAPTLLCLHGFTGSGKDFLPLLSALGAGRVNWVCIDFPGHGGSAVPRLPEHYAVGNIVASINRIRGFSGAAGNVIILGYSMGARIALHYLRCFPDTGAILIGGSPGLRALDERARRRESDARWIGKLRDPHYSIDTFCAEWESQPLILPQTRLPEPLRGDIAARRRKNNPDGLANALAAWGQGALPHLWDELDRIKSALLVVGERDGKYQRIADEMSRINPSMRIRQVAGSGHSPHLERPDATAGVILDHLFRG